MKPATIKQIKDELKSKTAQDHMDIILKLGRFKKENKELLTYLLFEAHNELDYVSHIKDYIDEQWNLINNKSYYWVNKSVRKILRAVKKYIRYSKKKGTEAELILYFCKKLHDYSPHISRSSTLRNILFRELQNFKKSLAHLHEDLQYDYNKEINDEFRL